MLLFIDERFRAYYHHMFPEPYQEEVTENWEVNSEEREYIVVQNYVLIPKEAVCYGMVYVLETVEVPYGSYEVARLKVVELAGETDSMVKVQKGLSEKDRVVAVFCDTLDDGLRVVPNEL